jgi:AraC-like DNA-binding protein
VLRRLPSVDDFLRAPLGAFVGGAYRDEQRAIRFAAATRLLTAPDARVAAVAAAVGLSEAGLALLIRRETGLTIQVYRKQLRRD